MFKILVATDGSKCANLAVDYARLLARQIANVEITILTVIDAGIMAQPFVAPPTMPVFLSEALELAASAAVEGARQRLSGAHKKVTVRIESGAPAPVICDIAETESFDLIVMGSRGQGRVSCILLGSVSDKVVHQANVPVLIVRTKEGSDK